jgi:hypothetical protein
MFIISGLTRARATCSSFLQSARTQIRTGPMQLACHSRLGHFRQPEIHIGAQLVFARFLIHVQCAHDILHG